MSARYEVATAPGAIPLISTYLVPWEPPPVRRSAAGRQRPILPTPAREVTMDLTLEAESTV